MTELEQQIVIAEFCGLKVRRVHNTLTKQDEFCQDDPVTECRLPLPDYLHDLNAMHEAEARLDPTGHPCQRHLFGSLLRSTLRLDSYMHIYWLGWCFAHATAAQRAETLLRTIGKWKDSQ